jgi:hypothetical protein
MGTQQKLMIDEAKHFHLGEPGLFIIYELQETSIIKQELVNIYSMISS